MTKRIVLFALAALTLIASGCKKDKNDPVATREAKEITSNSAILYGHVNPDELKGSTELGVIVSKNDDLDLGGGKKYPATVVDKKNIFHVQATGLALLTKYYYTAYITIGAASYIGKTKTFTTIDGEGGEENGGGGNVDDNSPIKLGRWDAYSNDILEQCLIFDNIYVNMYDFCGGSRIKGEYSYENNRLIIDPVREWWGISYAYMNFPDNYNWIDPDTLEPIQNEDCLGWRRYEGIEELQDNLIRWGAEWWLDREFILDSATTAHGAGKDNLVYKYRAQ